jgi:hypothetical protein
VHVLDLPRSTAGCEPALREELELLNAEAHELEECIAHNVAQLLNGYSLER